jgi:hypothetical protein
MNPQVERADKKGVSCFQQWLIFFVECDDAIFNLPM